MCLLLFAYRLHPDYPLVVAANRDEFHRRPTEPARWWADKSVLAGRDLEAGGTWMGVNRRGRFAVVTNYRDPASNHRELRSRGRVVLEALEHPGPAAALLGVLEREGPLYNGFNLVFGDSDGLFVYSNRGQAAPLQPGLYGLSNHLLETPWPKVTRGKAALARYLQGPEIPVIAPLFGLLADRHVAADAELPNTGIGLDWERRLAPMFIVSPDYGTRASTVLIADRNGQIHYAERSFTPSGDIDGEREFRFRADSL